MDELDNILTFWLDFDVKSSPYYEELKKELLKWKHGDYAFENGKKWRPVEEA